jgi:iron complex outermembrane receptor protein
LRGGFRTDWYPSAENDFTFQGDAYAGWIEQMFGTFDPLNPPTFDTPVQTVMHVEGANGLGRWTHRVSDTSEFKLQAYYDFTSRDAAIIDEQRHTFDLNFQDQFAVGDRNQVVWGLGYRVTADQQIATPTLSFNPLSQTVNLYSAFVQDELAIVKDRLSLTVGSKFEHNDYTGLEIQPGGQLLWTPTEHQTFWGSISRAVRTPSRGEESIILTQSHEVAPNIFVPVTILGTSSFQTEDMIAYETGYRAEPFKKLSLDVAVFYNDYEHLRSFQANPVNPTQLTIGNGVDGYTYGLEASATWRVKDWWRVQPMYTFLQMKMHADPVGGSPPDNATATLLEGQSPENQFTLRSSMDLPHGVTLDAAVRYVDNLPAYHIDSYFELEVHVSWQVTKNLEVSLTGQNLLHDQHPEFSPTYVNTQNGQITEIPRSVFGKVTWKF